MALQPKNDKKNYVYSVLGFKEGCSRGVVVFFRGFPRFGGVWWVEFVPEFGDGGGFMELAGQREW